MMGIWGFDRKKKVHIEDINRVKILTDIIKNTMGRAGYREGQEIVIVGIGTDRSTGDSLGPLVGNILKQKNIDAVVYGDLNNPVHATNLSDIIGKIKNKHKDSFVIAIDSGLGKSSSVGYIDVKSEPLKPGTGVNKNLPEIGDIHIGGIVNVGGYMEYLVLQSTRLSVVMKMAETIADSLIECVDAKELKTV